MPKTTEEFRAERAAYMREWTRKNKDRLSAERAARYANSVEQREKIRQRVQDWRKKDPERTKQLRRESYERNKSLKGGLPKGENHPGWRGDDVRYIALHAWVARHLGKPNKCSLCGTETAKKFEWANVDHEYRRDVADYFRACTSCHRKHDDAKFGRTSNKSLLKRSPVLIGYA